MKRFVASALHFCLSTPQPFNHLASVVKAQARHVTLIRRGSTISSDSFRLLVTGGLPKITVQPITITPENKLKSKLFYDDDIFDDSDAMTSLFMLFGLSQIPFSAVEMKSLIPQCEIRYVVEFAEWNLQSASRTILRAFTSDDASTIAAKFFSIMHGSNDMSETEKRASHYIKKNFIVVPTPNLVQRRGLLRSFTTFVPHGADPKVDYLPIPKSVIRQCIDRLLFFSIAPQIITTAVDSDGVGETWCKEIVNNYGGEEQFEIMLQYSSLARFCDSFKFFRELVLMGSGQTTVKMLRHIWNRNTGTLDSISTALDVPREKAAPLLKALGFSVVIGSTVEGERCNLIDERLYSYRINDMTRQEPPNGTLFNPAKKIDELDLRPMRSAWTLCPNGMMHFRNGSSIAHQVHDILLSHGGGKMTIDLLRQALNWEILGFFSLVAWHAGPCQSNKLPLVQFLRSYPSAFHIFRQQMGDQPKWCVELLPGATVPPGIPSLTSQWGRYVDESDESISVAMLEKGDVDSLAAIESPTIAIQRQVAEHANKIIKIHSTLPPHGEIQVCTLVPSGNQIHYIVFPSDNSVEIAPADCLVNAKELIDELAPNGPSIARLAQALFAHDTGTLMSAGGKELLSHVEQPYNSNLHIVFRQGFINAVRVVEKGKGKEASLFIAFAKWVHKANELLDSIVEGTPVTLELMFTVFETAVKPRLLQNIGFSKIFLHECSGWPNGLSTLHLDRWLGWTSRGVGKRLGPLHEFLDEVFPSVCPDLSLIRAAGALSKKKKKKEEWWIASNFQKLGAFDPTVPSAIGAPVPVVSGSEIESSASTKGAPAVAAPPPAAFRKDAPQVASTWDDVTEYVQKPEPDLSTCLPCQYRLKPKADPEDHVDWPSPASVILSLLAITPLRSSNSAILRAQALRKFQLFLEPLLWYSPSYVPQVLFDILIVNNGNRAGLIKAARHFFLSVRMLSRGEVPGCEDEETEDVNFLRLNLEHLNMYQRPVMGEATFPEVFLYLCGLCDGLSLDLAPPGPQYCPPAGSVPQVSPLGTFGSKRNLSSCFYIQPRMSQPTSGALFTLLLQQFLPKLSSSDLKQKSFTLHFTESQSAASSEGLLMVIAELGRALMWRESEPLPFVLERNGCVVAPLYFFMNYLLFGPSFPGNEQSAKLLCAALPPNEAVWDPIARVFVIATARNDQFLCSQEDIFYFVSEIVPRLRKRKQLEAKEGVPLLFLTAQELPNSDVEGAEKFSNHMHFRAEGAIARQKRPDVPPTSPVARTPMAQGSVFSEFPFRHWVVVGVPEVNWGLPVFDVVMQLEPLEKHLLGALKRHIFGFISATRGEFVLVRDLERRSLWNLNSKLFGSHGPLLLALFRYVDAMGASTDILLARSSENEWAVCRI